MAAGALLACALVWISASGQPPKLTDGSEPLVTKVYDLGELMLGVHDYAAPPAVPETRVDNVNLFSAIELPAGQGPSGAGFGGGGLGGGGGGLGGGGGMVQPAERYRPPKTPVPILSLHDVDVSEAIRNAVDPESWDELGGPGSIGTFGEMIVVTQTEQVHQKLAAMIEEIGSRFPKPQTVRIRGIWVLPQESVADEYVTGKPAPAERLKADLATGLFFVSEVAGQVGQTFHITAGDQRARVTKTVPVISAQATTADPFLFPIQLGVSFQVTPSLSDDRNTVTLQFSGSFADEVSARSSAAIDVPGVQLVASGFDSTMNLPPGQTVTAARMSYRPNDPSDDPRQLVLVVQAFINSN